MTEARNAALAKRLDRLAEANNNSPVVLVDKRAVLDAIPSAAEILHGDAPDEFIVVWEAKRYRLTAELTQRFSQAGIPLRMPLSLKRAPKIAFLGVQAEPAPREATRPAPPNPTATAKPPHYVSYKQRILAQEAIQQSETTTFVGGN